MGGCEKARWYMLEGWAVLEEENTHSSANTQTTHTHKYAGNQVMQGGSPIAEVDT